jgi:exo-1,4-beta-D-glucosaminidase
VKSKLFFSLAAFFFLISYAQFATAQSTTLVELQTGWRLASAKNVEDAAVSTPGFDDSNWYPIRRLPATVLQVLEDNGVYKDIYYGTNLTSPGDLWKQDWWYRTTFTAPAGQQAYTLIFKGINYRADIWLNGSRIADSSQAVGMYNAFEFDVTKQIKPGAANILAVKITPERGLLSPNGILGSDHPVELADSWLDWINWKYIGYQDFEHQVVVPFVPDRNAGVWKRVFLSATGPVTVRNAYVATDLPLPATTPARLTVYCDLSNHTNKLVSGTLRGEISRPGKPTITFEKQVSLVADEVKEASFTPEDVDKLTVSEPDLWWPYQWGKPNLYHLKLDFAVDGKSSDAQDIDFGIRKIVQHRDNDESFPNIGTGGGNFYLQINGRDYLIRGADYTPDLLFKNDAQRDADHIRYIKDLGLNLVRWELKIADDTMIDRADREGIPVMLGWMCCMQWEHWNLWSAEDQWVARASLRARLRELRSHPSVVMWANGSDGLPPDPVLNDYHQIEKELHWQNAIVDTVADKNRFWSGIHMVGPYVWRPPYYWFSDQYGPARGSSAEEGDNETIPPLDSLKKFIPAEKLWPPNDTWFFHAGSNEGNSNLANITRVLEHRYGPSSSVEEFVKKAQVAHYEDVRAQFETYATHWSNRKMLMHWMMNSQWPSFFGHLYDYYFKQGGGYFGAKKAMQPRTVVWDYYATGDRSRGHVYAVNLTPEPLHGKVTVSFYNVDGSRKYTNSAVADVPPNSSKDALAVARIQGLSSAYFVRCQLFDDRGEVLAENVYWQSTTDDNLGNPSNDEQFATNLSQWADLTALNHLPAVQLKVAGAVASNGDERTVTTTLTNTSNHIAFFVRVDATAGAGGDEVLPIIYDDNYVTLLPHESRKITAKIDMTQLDGKQPAVRVEGYNVPKQVVPLP